MIRMENYGQIMGQQQHDSTTTNSSTNRNKNDDNTRTDLSSNYAAAAAAAMPLLVTTATNHHHYDDYFQSAPVASSAADKNPSGGGVIKSETSQPPRFYSYPWLMSSHHHQPSDSHLHHHQLQLHRRHRAEEGGGGSDDGGVSNRSGGGVEGEEGSNEVESLKAKIVAHPQYSKLLQAYADCQKVGAPPEVAARLTSILYDFQTRNHQTSSSSATTTITSSSKDPELDQFMEAYYDMLVKYKEELTRPVQEAIEFMSRIESQLNNLLSSSNASAARQPPPRLFTSDDKSEGNAASSEDEQENSGGETELPEIDPRAEDRELKTHLLKKYGGYLSSLKQELSKKRKKGKLPKEARQKLLSWWELHYKWPYPSESEKVALAEATGLDQKQINNWFINQRKRHWKPSEDMQFMVMDGIHPQTSALYMEGHYMGNGPYRFGT